MKPNTYVLILAGGSGTRFWPLSRDSKPKQLLTLFDDETLMNKTVNRLADLVSVENIYVLTNVLQRDAVLEVLPQLNPENVIAEPAKRDTAPAVALGVGIMAARDPEATMVVLPADQLINDVDAYVEVMQDAITAAATTDGLVTVGIKPTWPSSSFGYIERGESVPIEGVKHEVKSVVRFREKPSTELAEQFIAKGNFSWNAGMFIWSIPTVRAELEAQCPELANFVTEIAAAEDFTTVVDEKFKSLEATSIDYALMEGAKKILNIEATFDWDDVGSWVSVSKYLKEKESNKTNSPLVCHESTGNIVFTQSGKKQVALLGVDDLIVVETEDAILVANKHDADYIKKIVQMLPRGLT